MIFEHIQAKKMRLSLGGPHFFIDQNSLIIRRLGNECDHK